MSFVFVSGALDNEELAAETILAGASNFVLKNNLQRLPKVLAKTVLEEAHAWSDAYPEMSRELFYHNNSRLAAAMRKYLEALDQESRENASADIRAVLDSIKKLNK